MKEQLIKSLFFIGFMCILYSCNRDDEMSDPVGGNEMAGQQSEFVIHAGEVLGFSGDRYVMATAPTTGEILYWDVMTSFRDSITFDAGGAETVDLTYASEYASGFSIVTYRDIRSEFKLSRFLYFCYPGQYSPENPNLKSVNIIISGTKEIVELINPGYNFRADLQEPENGKIDEENNIIYDYENDITIINASLGITNLDMQFVFKFTGEQDYKSVIIKGDEWIRIDEENFEKELEMEDLLACNVHEIAVGRDDGWIVESEVLTTEGERIGIAWWRNYKQTQHGESIRLYLQEGKEVEQIFIKLRSNYTVGGSRAQKYFDKIPTAITLSEFDDEQQELTLDKFNYTTSLAYNLAKMSYDYKRNNVISTWEIYQTSESTLDYTLPQLHNDFLDQTEFIKSMLTEPDNFKREYYSLDDEVEEIYHETGIDRQLQCIGYSSSYDSFKF